MTVKAIETTYKGFRFRSRLEARWAIFFDSLGFHWQYEPQGFEIDGSCYLPDFLVETNREKRAAHNAKHPSEALQQSLLWLEVKPTNELTDEDSRKCIAFATSLPMPEFGKDQSFRILAGQPGVGEYEVMSLPPPWKDRPRKFETNTGECFVDCPLCDTLEIRDPENASSHRGPGIFCEWCDCVRTDCREDNDDAWFSKGNVFAKNVGIFVASQRLAQAYQKAKSARFEHGETPR